MKILPIRKTLEFKQISSKGEKFYSKTVLLLSQATPKFYLQDLSQDKKAKDFCRVGFTVSKTVGNAVIRNRAKRRLREAFRALLIHAQNNFDYVLIARKEIATQDYNKILADLKFCLTRIHKLKPKNFSDDKRNERKA